MKLGCGDDFRDGCPHHLFHSGMRIRASTYKDTTTKAEQEHYPLQTGVDAGGVQRLPTPRDDQILRVWVSIIGAV